MKIFLKVLRGLLIVAPFLIVYFTKSEFADGGFFLFYIIASLVLLGALLGVAFYEDQWDGDPGMPCRVIRLIVLIAMAILSALSGVDDNLVLDEWYTYMMVALLFTIFFYFMYLGLSFISSGVFFTITGIVCVISLIIIPLFKLEPSAVRAVGGVAIAFAIIGFPLMWCIQKLSGLGGSRSRSRSSSSGGKRVGYNEIYNAVQAFNRDCAGVFKASISSSSSGSIRITLTDAHGGNVYSSDASTLRRYIERKTGADLDDCNVYINY
ncbi:MAG: hypothetical protein IKA43_06130 [Clostridia bacterium]|nr:hypothetical protein [Clostridia bacterium]MBR2296961.1 hypothetical protein [Clostridia bacterium]